MRVMADLKPCPFCGGDGCGGTYGDIQQCARCGAECGFDDEDNQNWNTRPIEDAKDATLSEIRAILAEPVREAVEEAIYPGPVKLFFSIPTAKRLHELLGGDHAARANREGK